MNYETIFKKLKISLREQTYNAYKESFGTSEYFPRLSILVHRAFDAFASGFDIPANKRGDFLDMLKKHAIYYRQDRVTSGLEALFHTLPPEFNVRGKWVSEHLAITI